MPILIPFSASAGFCFTSSTSVKHFTLRTFFIWGNKNKVTWGKIRCIGRVRHWGHAIFCQKLLNTQWGVGRWALQSPIMKWVKYVESSKKISLKLNTASHSNASWCTDIGGFLEHSPSREILYKVPTLQNIIPFWGFPYCINHDLLFNVSLTFTKALQVLTLIYNIE